jgi:hypothetical protein
MRHLKPWELWLASDATQNRLLNDAATDVLLLQDQQAQTGATLRRLAQVDKTQAAELDRLRATINVLVSMLVEAGALDAKVFGYRMEAALADLAPEPPAPPPAAAPPEEVESGELTR